MLLIKKLAKMGEDALKGRLIPFTIKKVKRAFESAIDSLESANVSSEETIKKLEASIAKGETDDIRSVMRETLGIDERTKQIEVLNTLRARLFAEAPKDEEEEDDE